MQALVVPRAGQLEVQNVPKPPIGPYEALVHITCCGICNSTDWKVVAGQMPWAGDFPLVLGHESVGVVEAVGERVRKYKVGDQVTRPINRRTPELGSAWGGFAEFGIVTDARAMADDGDASLIDDYNAQRQNVVPTEVDPVDAALAISLAETASVLDGLPSLAGRRVLVAGTGIAGLALTLWSKLAGARCVVTLGRRAERLDHARRIGADAAIDTSAPNWQAKTQSELGGPADVILEAIGNVEFATSLLDLLAANGIATAYGAPPDGQRFSDGWNHAAVNEHDRYPWVIDLMQRGWIDAEWFVSHRWPFEQVVEAMQCVKRGDVLKGFVLM